ncbi:MAG: OsmC family protein [Bacteroidetes bacterium]|nr:OsmC family protein [Bacteroidota bacterium]
MVKIELARINADFDFEATGPNGHKVQMQNGTHNFGTSPMQLLLMALGGCSAIDMVSILKKQRQDLKDIKITITGDKDPNAAPSLWQTASLEFHVYGPVDQDKALRAAALSMEKFCSVAMTLKGSGTEIDWKVVMHP